MDVGGPPPPPFTLPNSGGNPAQAGINFTDTLPANVVVAAAPNSSSTCPSGTGVVTAAAGSGTVTVTGAAMNGGHPSRLTPLAGPPPAPRRPHNNTATTTPAH